MDSFIKHANNNQFIVNLGLERVSLLLSLLGNPQDKINVIHIAGTNGKGSVCAFLKSILISAKFKTGLFSSPELVDIHERISINGINIAQKDLTILFEKVEKASLAVEEQIGEKPSPFEIWTACAYLHFYEEKCDFAIIEVGMGGDSDATNVVSNPLLTVITRLSLDHTDFLGATLEEIAQHKCGIIKPNCPLVTIMQPEEGMEVIFKECNKKLAPLFLTSPLKSECEDIYEIVSYNSQNIKLGLGGINQCENASLAIQCALLLDIEDCFIKEGLSKAVHKGRFELLNNDPYIIFDGAHNPDGAKSLYENLTRYFEGEKFTLVYSAMRDKDINSVLEILSPIAEEIVFTSVSENSRSATKKDYPKNALYYPTPSEAIKYALSKDKKIIITGSLYLYKDLEKNKCE